MASALCSHGADTRMNLVFRSTNLVRGTEWLASYLGALFVPRG